MSKKQKYYVIWAGHKTGIFDTWAETEQNIKGFQNAQFKSFETKDVLFFRGPFPLGTVNLGEFLAIVHGLAYLKKNNCPFPIYSDSRTAISWVKKKAIKTNLERSPVTEDLFKMVDSALEWLHKNSYSTKILKWETEDWGENPADYGRK